MEAKRRRANMSMGEKIIINNVYKGLRARDDTLNVAGAVSLCSELTQVSERSIFRIIKERREDSIENDVPNVPTVKKEKRGRKRVCLDDDTRRGIRRHIHYFFFRNEIPNLEKITQRINDDDSLPQISSRVLKRTLHEMNFRFMKRSRKSALIEKEEIVLWRRKYISQLREYRRENRKIYYLDETWVNEGHTVQKVWQDLNVKSRREAFMEGWSTGLKAPSGKGRRLIVTHIGSEDGFLNNGLLLFESKKTGDYHEDMDADRFEQWFESILPNIERGSVVIMDNAPYHSRRLERFPTSAWRKGEIIDWLEMKNIPFEETMLKVELLNIARVHKPAMVKYAVDERARESGVLVHRLPPYHCELNPIELIWAQVKSDVAKNNTTFKLNDVKCLFESAISKISAQSWQNCIRHVLKEEDRMWDLDIRIDVVIEPVVININQDSDSVEDTSDSDLDLE